MSRIVRRKKKLQNNKFKTALIVLIIAVCLFTIYKYNFTTKSEVTAQAAVKFVELEGENELFDNVEILEDERGKYIILPEKVNGIFTSAYYLSDIENVEHTSTNTNTTTDNTVSNETENSAITNEITVQTENTVSSDTTSPANTISETDTTNATSENSNTTTTSEENKVVNKIVEDKVVETPVVPEISTTDTTQAATESTTTSETNQVTEEQTSGEETQSAQEQIEELTETTSLFEAATFNSEEYADKLEEIAGVETTESTSNVDNSSQASAETVGTSATSTSENTNQTANGTQSSTGETSQVANLTTDTTTSKTTTESDELDATLPGDKYYLSDEEIEDESLELTVKFQIVEINGVTLYNQEFTSDMENAIITLTCYTPLGYYIDVAEQDVNEIQELKADVESLADSETILAYDITITNGEEEYQPEDYYQVATVSITKPDTIDFVEKTNSLQLLHIKEDSQTVNFQKMQMSKVENDGFEFVTDEFSIYAVILYNAISDDTVTIDDYTSDYNYYIGKNYTDNNGTYPENPSYTASSLAKVTINYHGNVEENTPLDSGNEKVTNTIIDKSSTQYFETSNLTLTNTSYNANRWKENETRTVSLTFSLDDITSEMIPDGSKFTITSLVLNLPKDSWGRNQFSLSNSDGNTNEYVINGNNISNLIVNADDYDRENNTITIIINITKNARDTKVTFSTNVSSITLTGTRYTVETEDITYYYKTELTTEDYGYISADDEERQNVVTYVKCVPITSGSISLELIDNPFMDRPTAEKNYYTDEECTNLVESSSLGTEKILCGFDGWKTAAGANYTISYDSTNNVQTVVANATAGSEITIDLYANWKKANTVYIGSSGTGDADGTSVNDLLGCSNLSDAISKLYDNGLVTATAASNRELNIIVVVSGSITADTFNSTSTNNYGGFGGYGNNSTNVACTITSLYAGTDYRSSSNYIRLSGNITLQNDLQLDFLNITNGGDDYKTVLRDDRWNDWRDYNYNDFNHIYAQGYNLRIGRGMQPLGDTATFGSVECGWRDKKTKCVIESGNYTEIFTIDGVGTTVNGYSSHMELVVGNDYDRVKGDNSTLYIYDRLSGRRNSGITRTCDNNKDVYKTIVKSGTIGIGCFENEGSSDAYYAGIYVGGHSGSTDDDTHDEGNRVLIVEGGNIANIIGGLFINNSNRYATYIYVKGGNIVNIVGGAGYTHTYGDRIIQVTGGCIKYSISGGSNGYAASTSSNNGQLSGKTLVYVGGNARIGATVTTNDDGTKTYTTTTTSLYDVSPGCVCGGANGNSSYQGQTDGSHIIIDGDAVIYGSVYGGGNYGYIEDSSNTNSTYAVTIDILGGTIEKSVFGGANQNKIVGDVDINISGGTINGTSDGAVFGGSNTSGNIEGTVNIDIDGGNIGTQVANDAIFGGGYGSNTNVNEDVNISINDDTSGNVNPNDVTIKGNVFGGSSKGNILGNIKVNVEDHYSDDYSITIEGNILGGGKGTSDSTPQNKKDVTVIIDGGEYKSATVYGGCYTSGQILGNILVKIGENYDTFVTEVYGGGNEADVDTQTDSVYVYLYNHATVTRAFNGGNSAGISGNNTDHPRAIYAIGATVKDAIYGGCNVKGSMQTTYVYCKDGAQVANVYGGGKGESAKVTDDGTHVIITSITDSNTYSGTDGKQTTVSGNVYGGGEKATVNSTTDVKIYASKVGEDDVLDYEHGNVFGGGNEALVKGNTSVTVDAFTDSETGSVIGSTIYQIYGGGSQAAVGTDTTDNDIKSATIDVTSSTVTNIYGGGFAGVTNGSTSVTVQNESTINNNVYGGGEGSTATVQKSTAVTINDSNVKNNVYGGGSKGAVKGNTIVNIGGTTDSTYSVITNDVFGGGENASVNGTTVAITSKSIAQNVYGGGDNGITVQDTSVALRNAIINESAFGAGNGSSALVKGKSYIYACGETQIAQSIFAGGNNAITGTEDTNPNNPNNTLDDTADSKATAIVDIAGATVGENVYGGANTSKIYGNTAVNIGSEAITAYYTEIEESVPSYTIGKIDIKGTIYGGGEQMDPNKEYSYDTVSVEGYIDINIDGTGYDTNGNTINIAGSIFGSGHASRAGLPDSYSSSSSSSESTSTSYVTINGDVNIKNYGTIDSPKSMVSIQRCSEVVVDNSALWISGATDSTNTHSTTYFSFNRIGALKLKNSSTLYLRATSNLLESYYSLYDNEDDEEEKVAVKIINAITGEDGNIYNATGNYIYGSDGETIEYIVDNGQIFKYEDGTKGDLVTDVKSSETKSVEKDADNRIYMYSGLNLNISTDENLVEDAWGPVEGMTFFGIYNTTNTTIDTDEDTDISQTTDTNSDSKTIHTGIYSKDYAVSSTTLVNWDDRDFNRSYVEGQHVKNPEQNIQEDGFYTNFEKFGEDYDDSVEINSENYASYNPTSYTDYITPTPTTAKYYIWYAGPDQDYYYYSLSLVASKLSTYGTLEKTLQGLSVANATFKITSVDSSLVNGAVLYEKSAISSINTTGDPNKEFALSMKTGGSGWSMNGETDFVTSPKVSFSGTETYKTENSDTTPTLGFYLYHSNNISEELDLGYFTINMTLYYWKSSTQQARARVTIDVAISTRVYDDIGYDASITPGRQYEIFPRSTTNITTKSSFSAYFQLYEEDIANNEALTSFFTKMTTDSETNTTTEVVDTEKINKFLETSYRRIETNYVFPEDTTITMIDLSTDNPVYYYYTVTADDVTGNKTEFNFSEFMKMGSTAKGDTEEAKKAIEYYQDSNRSNYTTTIDGVTYQSEEFIFIVDFESAKFNISDDTYEVTSGRYFHIVLTSDVTNEDGSNLEISVLEEYKTSNSISYGIYNTDSKIELEGSINPSRIYLGDSADISITTNYIVGDGTVNVYDTRYFDSKLGVKITIYDEEDKVVEGANLLGAYFKVVEADGTQTSYYPRTDGTTRMKIADKVSNSKATITFETANSSLPTGTYKFVIESFGSADGVYFGTESSASTSLTLNIINDEFGLESTIPSTYIIRDKTTGYGLEDDTEGFILEKEYQVEDENGNVIGQTTAELNNGKNTLEYDLEYSSGYENPLITVALYRRDYDEVYERTYSLVDLATYLSEDKASELTTVPDDIKDQYILSTSGECVRIYSI